MSRRTSVSHPLLPTRKPRRQSINNTRRVERQPSFIRSRRLLLCLGTIFLLCIGYFGWNSIEARTVYYLNNWTPASIHHVWNTPDMSRVRWTTKCPAVVPGVHAAKWAGSWETPRLVKPKGDELGPAILMLHIFSIPNTTSRLKRQVIRKHHPLLAIPEAYRHLVDVKFIIGYPREECRGRLNETLCPGVAAEEEAIAEEERYGDLIRLEGLKDGENMDNGKTWEWIRYIGKEGRREAQWVFKCDDDNLPILQNLIPFLLSLNPNVPTYLGQAWLDESFYLMLGYMYGMSWGVVKTLATAQVTSEDIQISLPEDVRTAQLLLSLPPIPHNHDSPHQHNQQGKHHRQPSNPYVFIPPPSPRTGLVRLDIRGYLANYGNGDSYSGDRAFGWHNLKTDKIYEEAWNVARKALAEKGREVWQPTEDMTFLARE